MLAIDLLDVCLPDYFQGSSPDSGIVLAVSVFREMTKEELIEAIVDEWTAGSDEDERFDAVTSSDIREAAIAFTQHAKEGGLFPHAPSREDETLDSPYAYCLVRPPESEVAP